MKKKLTVVTAAALLASITFSAAACTESDTNLLIPKANGTYSAAVTQLLPTSTYSYEDKEYETQYNGKDSYVVGNVNYNEVIGSDDNSTLIYRCTAFSYNESTDLSMPEIKPVYKLFDLKTNAFTEVSSENQIYCLDDGLFYSIADEEDAFPGTYTLYSSTAVLAENVYGYADTNAGIFYSEDDNSRTYVDYNGVIKTEKNPFKKILTGNSYTTETNSYYLVPDMSNPDDMIISVFDKEANYLYSFDFYRMAGISEDAEITAAWTVGDKLFFQTAYELPEHADKYDFYTEETKFNFNTYSYDLSDYADDKVAPEFIMEDLDFVVYNTFEVSPEFAILSVCTIDDNYMLSKPVLQSYDVDGDIYLDFQELVPGAVSANYFGNYLYLYDAFGKCYIYSEDELVYAIDYVVDLDDINGGSYEKRNNVLYFYNEKGEQIHSATGIIESGETNDGNVWYKKQARKSDDASLYVYNAATNQEKLILTYKANPEAANANKTNYEKLVAVYDDFCIVEKVTFSSQMGNDGLQYTSETTYSVYFLANVADATPMTGYDEIEYIETCYTNDGATSYNVFALITRTETDNSQAEECLYYTVTCTNPTYEYVVED